MSRGTSPPRERPELPAVERPEHVPASEFAYDYVKQRIVNLTLPPGEIVTEMDIATVTGLSRTPVREAFLRLDAEKLIELLPRRGARITQVTAREVRELARTRLALEVYAAREIHHQQITIADALWSSVERQRKLMNQGASYPTIIECDREFHNTIVSAVGNSVLTEVYTSMGDRQQRTGVAAFFAQPGRAERALEHHEQIVEAFTNFDLDRTITLLDEHLDRNSIGLERYLP